MVSPKGTKLGAPSESVKRLLERNRFENLAPNIILLFGYDYLQLAKIWCRGIAQALTFESFECLIKTFGVIFRGGCAVVDDGELVQTQSNKQKTLRFWLA